MSGGHSRRRTGASTLLAPRRERGEGIVESPAAMPERLRCRWPRGSGLLSLACPRESNQREGRPGAAENPCASRLVRARAELAERKKPRPAQTPARDTSRPRLRCSAAATGPNVKCNSSHRKARYSLRRAGQAHSAVTRRSTEIHPAQFTSFIAPYAGSFSQEGKSGQEPERLFDSRTLPPIATTQHKQKESKQQSRMRQMRMPRRHQA